MIKKHLITRPQDEAKIFAAKLAKNGGATIICSLTEIIYQLPKIKTTAVQAFIATSANALKKLDGTQFSAPLYVVGSQTAQIAQKKGFKLIKTAAGDSSALIELVKAECSPKQGKLFYLAGTPRSRDLASALSEYEIEIAELYHAKPITILPPLVKTAITSREIDSASFFSPRAAEIFCRLTPPNAVQNITALCFSKSISQKLASHNFFDIKTIPTTEKMLELLKQEK